VRTFVKRDPAAPPGFFGCEAAGLQWLSTAAGGVRCARVVAHDHQSLTLEHVESVGPSESAAREFGARLAHTHDAGAEVFGAAPDGWNGPGFFGPLGRPLAISFTGHHSWGAFYADERLRPLLEQARPQLREDTVRGIETVIRRCGAGEFDDTDAPARIHGDLWSGNVMWSGRGVVLIDPAAHGGHRETDLAMLALFGCPHLDVIVRGYQAVHPLTAGWRDRTALHQLYPLLAHVVLFGGGYRAQVARAAAAVLEIS
jgi:fructosamine-3-kinase